MISPSLRFAGLVGAAVLGLTVGPALHAQVTTVDWTGAVNSNYLTAGNWSTGVVPGTLSDIRLVTAVANTTINLNYTGTGNYTQQIYAIQAGVNLTYTLNLSGTANGMLIYDIVGRGTHPFTTAATGTSTGNASQRLSFYVNLGPYAQINFAGSPASPNPGGSTSGLTYAKVTMVNSSIDASMMPNATGNTLQLGGVSLDRNSWVYSGAYGMTISALCATGEEETWAGHVYQAATATIGTQKWGTGITRVTPTGVVDLPGGMSLRAAGQYLVDGVHNGNITSNNSSGSVIGGTGTINGLVTVGTGTSLAPAGRNAFGTLTVNGNLNLNGALSFELNTQSEYDRLILNGILTPAATSSLNVGVTAAFPLRPGTFRVMTFNSMVGSFGSVSLPSSQGLGASYSIGANYIDIIFTQLAYGTNPLLTNNYLAVANVLDQAVLNGKVSGDLLENLNRQPSIGFFQEVLDQLMPTCYYSWYPAAVTRANTMTQMVSDRLAQRPERVKGSYDTYIMTSRQESSIDASQWADYTNYDTMSILGGVDTVVGQNLTAGGFLQYASTRSDLNQLFSSSTTDSYTGGLYAQYRRGAIEAHAVGFAGTDKYASKRNVERTKVAQWANGSTKGRHLGASIDASYTYKHKWVEVSPNIGFQVVDWAVDGFTEKDAGEVSLRIKSQYEANMAGRVGLRFAQTFPTKRGTIRPFVNIGYRHDFGDETRKIKGEAFGQPISVTVPGTQKSGIRFDSGVDWSIASRVSAQVRYTTETGGAADESVGIHGGVNVSF